MTIKTAVLRVFPWLQILLSILLAGTILVGYMVFKTPLATAIDALSSSIFSVSNVIEATAGTLGTKKELIDSARQTMALTRVAIKEASAAISDQTAQASKRAEELQAVVSVTLRTSDALNSLGDGLIGFTAPMDIVFEGVKPLVVMKRPLETYGKTLKPIAQELKTISDGVMQLSKTVATDGVRLGTAFTKLEESERTLEGVQNQDVPRSIKEMRDAAVHLKSVSQEMAAVSGGFAWVVLLAGLLFSAWMFLNSINMIVLGNRYNGTEIE
jgi:methyl-accepting chemotaxis protein